MHCYFSPETILMAFSYQVRQNISVQYVQEHTTILNNSAAGFSSLSAFTTSQSSDGQQQRSWHLQANFGELLLNPEIRQN